MPFESFRMWCLLSNAIVDSTTSGQRTAVPVTTREWFAPGVGLVKWSATSTPSQLTNKAVTSPWNSSLETRLTE